jgi:nucleoside-diphosphate-sugar epimerase
MRTVLITGCNGTIGSILMAGLTGSDSRASGGYRVEGVDLPEDISSYEVLRPRIDGVDTVVHLAHEPHDPAEPIEQRMRIQPRNVRVDTNVFTAVVEAKVKRLVLASSVHADRHRDPAMAVPISVPGSYYPATPYGAYKLVGEEVGKVLSRQFGFEFVGVRFGGVTRDGSVKHGPGQTATWLSHRDLVGAIDACLKGEAVAGRSTVFYAVSANSDRIHETTNPFGWEPRDDSAQHS